MAAIFTIRYPEDRTGESQANRVKNEPHELPSRNVRAIAPLHGPFYVHNLTVRDKSNNRLLVRGVDYEVGEFYDVPSARSSKTVCAIILITNRQVSSLVEIDYNVYGGEFSYSTQALIDMINALNLDNRPVEWPNIIGIPDEFNPAPHLHDIGDLYGFEYLVSILDRVREAILIGDAAHHDAILDYIDRRNDEMVDLLDQLRAVIDAHIQNENNPHKVTRDQLDVFSRQETLDLIAALENAADAKIAALRADLNAHIANKGNPHGVTKAQVGLDKVMNYPIATNQQSDEATSNVVYSTPYSVNRTINAKVMPTLNAHINNKSNPHAVTKAQVGLDKVMNYPIATNQQSDEGTSNVVYSTPYSVSRTITTKALVPLNAHIADKNNPHGVTKAQVGLDLVMNYPMATKTQAEGGSLNTVYMSPLRTKELITKEVADLRAHVAITSGNPHGTTAAMVGAYTKAEIDKELGDNYLLINGSKNMTGTLIGANANLSMSQDSGTTKGSFVCRASGSGDWGLAGMTFHNDAYAIKLGVNTNGWFGAGGWSRAPWTFWSDPAGNFTAAGDVRAYSDPRLKEFTGTIDNPFTIIDQVRGYNYKWRHGIAHVAGKAGKYDKGFRSDEVERVLPEALGESVDIDGEVYSTVSYEKFIPVHHEGIRELRQTQLKQQRTIDILVAALVTAGIAVDLNEE